VHTDSVFTEQIVKSNGAPLRPYAYRTLPRGKLVAAVAPGDLASALDALVARGVIAGWADQVLIWGDLSKIEAALGISALADRVEWTEWTELRRGTQAAQAAQTHGSLRAVRPAVRPEARAAYFDAALAFIYAPAFKSQLDALSRRIWRRHAAGESYAVIAKKLRGVTVEKARWAVGQGRKLAGLPAVTSSMPRGGGRPPRAAPDESSRPRCKVCRCIIEPQGGSKWGGKTGRSGSSGARGMCHRHYQQWRAKRKAG